MIGIGDIKTILIAAAVVAAVWFFKDYQHQKSENKRQTENARMLRLRDSTMYAQQILSQREINDYLELQNTNLRTNLEQSNIKLNRIERIINQKLNYKDDRVNTIEAKGLVESVIDGKPYKTPVIDSTDCLVIRGSIEFDGEKIDLNINERNFKNVTDVVTYWERRKWSFLGIKTRLFGKKQVTVKVFNSCGETETYVVEKRE